MPNIFLVSDHHLGHSNILTFLKKDGTLLRPEFKDVDHMSEYIIEKHNSVVRSQDKVYFLGDSAMKDKYIALATRMNGKKRIILGNHDYGNVRLYQPYFEAIYSTRRLDNMILSHIPVHPESLGKAEACIHGHTHLDHEQNDVLGPRFFNVCVEALSYIPISLEDAKKKIMKGLDERRTN